MDQVADGQEQCHRVKEVVDHLAAHKDQRREPIEVKRIEKILVFCTSPVAGCGIKRQDDETDDPVEKPSTGLETLPPHVFLTFVHLYAVPIAVMA